MEHSDFFSFITSFVWTLRAVTQIRGCFADFILVIFYSSFQLKITAVRCIWVLRTTWAKTAAPTWYAALRCIWPLFVLTETGFRAGRRAIVGRGDFQCKRSLYGLLLGEGHWEKAMDGLRRGQKWVKSTYNSMSIEPVFFLFALAQGFYLVIAKNLYVDKVQNFSI